MQKAIYKGDIPQGNDSTT